MDVHENYAEWNAEKQVADKSSPYWYWANILKLRKDHVDVFVYGDFALVSPDDQNVIAYKRMLETEEGATEALVVCNFKDHEVEWVVPEEEKKLMGGKTLLANYGGEAPKGETVRLRAFEAFVVGDL